MGRASNYSAEAGRYWLSLDSWKASYGVAALAHNGSFALPSLLTFPLFTVTLWKCNLGLDSIRCDVM